MSDFNEKFSVIKIDEIGEMSKKKFDEGWRFVQLLAVKTEQGSDLVYSFMKDGLLDNVKVLDVKTTDEVESITNNFLAAFVFENEVHDLFGINIKNIAIDFKGKFYNVATDQPMTIVSPEVIARREKQKKVEAAKAAKAARDAKKKEEVENG